MKISHLIEDLQQRMAEFGNIEVRIDPNTLEEGEDHTPFAKVIVDGDDKPLYCVLMTVDCAREMESL